MPPVLGRSPVPASGELRGEDVENYAQLRGAAPPASPPKPQLPGAAPPASPPNPVPARGDTAPQGGAGGPDPGPLGERERTVLAFERQWWRHAGAKEEAIRREFGIGPTAYYQLLSRLIDDPAAIAYDPMLVKRLQRQRASRRRRRSWNRDRG
jgi:Protein of unknown function (DUF3263)